MTMISATLPASADDASRSQVQSSSGGDRPAGSRGKKQSNDVQRSAKDGKQASAARKNKNRKPKGQTSQGTQEPGAPAANVEVPFQYSNGEEQLHGALYASSGYHFTTGYGPAQNAEAYDVTEQGSKRQNRRKTRPKTQGAEGASVIDINQPRHAPDTISNTPMKQNEQTRPTSQSHESNRGQTPQQRPPPPQGAVGPTMTPSKHYAGPTFHASPAPASLPIPKFFSKSAPPPDKGPSMGPTTPPNEGSEESSSGALEDSPTMKSSLHAGRQQPREPSPLDVFFNADRQEKAKLSRGDANGTPPANRTNPFSLPPSASRSHSRHPTGSSIFPMEMEGASVPKTPNERRAESSTPNAANNDQSASEKIRAKTEALKQLLQLQPKQSSSPLLQSASIVPANNSSDSPAVMDFLRQTASESSTPDHSYGGSKSSAHGYGNGPFPPPPGPFNSPQPARPPSSARALSSQLRNEISMNGNRSHASLDHSFRATSSGHTSLNPPQPDYSPHPHRQGTTAAMGGSTGRSGYQPYPPFQQAQSVPYDEEAVRSGLAQHVESSHVAIEDELRKLLKISSRPAGTT